MTSSADAQVWLTRAEQARRLADQMTHPATRRELLLIADLTLMRTISGCPGDLFADLSWTNLVECSDEALVRPCPPRHQRASGRATR
jgi:hypothetical protein